MSATLVIMAAGLASRYGGAKQIEKVGPGGEILMEYTIHDAQRAGFDRFVIILQPQMLEDFRAVCGERLEGKAHVDYAFQSFDALPDWFAVPEGRTKPYGTVPAVLSGKDVITGKFAVVNADDYYGPGAFTLMYEALEKLPETGRGCMVAYKLRNTVSDFGTVTRGVCRIDGGEMTAVKETFKIGKVPDGSIRSFADSEEGVALDGEKPGIDELLGLHAVGARRDGDLLPYVPPLRDGQRAQERVPAADDGRRHAPRRVDAR